MVEIVDVETTDAGLAVWLLLMTFIMCCRNCLEDSFVMLGFRVFLVLSQGHQDP